MKIGYAQFTPTFMDLDATIERLEQLFEKDALHGVELLVLPELCNSGYNFSSKEEALTSSELAGKGPFSKYLWEKCKENGCHIVTGLNEREGDRLYNSAILIGPDGLEGRYRKLHLFLNEPDYFQPGNLGLPVFDIGPCRIGLLVCYDWAFPEAWRSLALKGADIICQPSNLVLPGLCQRVVPNHALINRLFTITANRTGTERGTTFTGMSTIADPKGELLLQATQTESCLGLVESEPEQARDKSITPRNDLFGDRRPEEYSG